MHRDGPLLVVAGAGTGKTRVITHRIAHLIRNGVRPDQILAVTFTNKAAAEMRDRVEQLLGTRYQVLASDPKPNTQYLAPSTLPFVGTFHSLGVHIIKESGRALNISRWFSIYDRDDSLSVVRKAIKGAGYDPKQFEPRTVLSAISRAKGNMFTPETYAENASPGFYTDLVLRVWRDYEKALREAGSLDFDDLLQKAVELLRDFPDVRKYYQDKWRYLHVDEYQDTNKVQYEIIRLISDEKMNVCAVGDGDQTIYTWRGATIENIQGFERDFPGAKVVILDENYRSTSNILDAANAIIKKNDNRHEKNLFTKSGAGAKISLYEAFDPSDEARHITETVRGIISPSTTLRAAVPAEEFAVLYRANFQSRALEEAFLSAGLPYTVVGTRFFDRAEIKDVLAYVKCALNPSDQASFARATATPRRGLGEKTLLQYFTQSIAGEKIRAFLALLENIRQALTSQPLPTALQHLVRVSGYEEILKQTGEEGTERLENIRELVNLAGKYKNLPTEEALEQFLTEAGLVSDQDALMHEDNKKRGVRLMTVHAAKGLEFRHVFVVGLEQDLFPHKRESLDFARDESSDSEERRLFYVALTRAKEKLHLSYCQVRQVYGEQRIGVPSEYISDIDPELIEQADIIPTAKSRGYLPDIEDIT